MCLLIASVTHQASAADTGKAAAMKYFSKNAKRQIKTRSPQSIPTAGGDRLLAVAVGSLLNARSYQWTEEELAGWNVELFYQKPTSGYFGQGFHLELQKFANEVDEFSKVSFLVRFTFPRRLSFPVYLGVAAGPGFFLEQREDESDFAFDYKAYLGVRLNEPNSQYFFQSGVKNHVHVLSDGQFIGWYVSSGVAYKF